MAKVITAPSLAQWLDVSVTGPGSAFLLAGGYQLFSFGEELAFLVRRGELVSCTPGWRNLGRVILCITIYFSTRSYWLKECPGSLTPCLAHTLQSCPLFRTRIRHLIIMPPPHVLAKIMDFYGWIRSLTVIYHRTRCLVYHLLSLRFPVSKHFSFQPDTMEFNRMAVQRALVMAPNGDNFRLNLSCGGHDPLPGHVNGLLCPSIDVRKRPMLYSVPLFSYVPILTHLDIVAHDEGLLGLLISRDDSLVHLGIVTVWPVTTSSWTRLFPCAKSAILTRCIT